MKVKVGNTVYELSKTTGEKIGELMCVPKEEHSEYEFSGCISRFDTDIFINKDYSAQIKKQTFWHEALHAMFYELGSDLAGDEGLVDSLSLLIYGMIENNNIAKIYEFLEKK